MIGKRRITKKTFVLTAVVGSLLIMALVSANALYSSRLARSETDEAVSTVSAFYLEAMADRRAKTISNLINSTFNEMEKAVTFIEDEGVSSQDELRAEIGKVTSLLGLNRFALVTEGDIVYTQYSTYTGRTRHAFLSEVLKSDRVISIVSPYGSSKQLCLAIPTPELSILGKPCKACFVQLNIDDIVDLLAFDDQGRTYFALYSQNGANLSETELGPLISEKNLFDALLDFVTEDVWTEQRKNFETGASGTMTFASGEAEETLCYAPVQGTDWQIVVLIRDSVIQNQIRDINEQVLTAQGRQITFTLISVLILAIVLLLQLRELSRGKIEKEKKASKAFRDMAHTDSMTGVQSKHAYTEAESNVDQRLQADEVRKLAVVVCDINGLKQVNDTQGHAAGDQLIRDASDLICEYFDRKTVYRIGGDEFVILLEGDDCATMTEKLDALNRITETNIAKGAVVIAFGCARLEQGDERLRDVFERADQMMYERKQKLKEMGAPTGR